MNHSFDDFILIHPLGAKLSADTYHREMEERRIQMFHHKSFASPTPTLTSDSIPSSPPSVSRHREKIDRSLFTDKYGCIEPRFLIPLLDFESQDKCNAEHKNDSMIGFKLRPRTRAAAGSFPFPSQSQSNLVSASPRHSLDFNSTALPSPLLLLQVSPRSALDASFAEMKAHPISRRHSLNDTRKMSRRSSGSHALAA